MKLREKVDVYEEDRCEKNWKAVGRKASIGSNLGISEKLRKTKGGKEEKND